MFYPELDKVKELSGQYKFIPVSMEAGADMETPITLFKRFEDSSYCFLLESVEGGEKWGRYSFIGRNPFLIFKSIGKKTYIEDKNSGLKILEDNPIEILKGLMNSCKGPIIPELPGFNGGAVGYFGYDLIRFYENLPNVSEDDLGLPESFFMFVDEVIAFDHQKQKIHIIVNLHTNGNIERAYKSATRRISEIYDEILSSCWKISGTYKPYSGRETADLCIKSNLTKEQFCENVVKGKQYIQKGDISQVVLSHRMCLKTDIRPFGAYRALRVINPSPYMYYIKSKDFIVAGSSPEMILRVEDRFMETCPIAGTRKRGATKQEDELLEKELLTDKKELNEHMMLVDLSVSEMKKISKNGTVAVKNLMHVEKYSHVMHMVSNVVGELRDDRTPLDAFLTVFPAGTVTGSPKTRAMEIIDELETVKRGPYGGAIGYLSFNGNLDSCITIRTIVFKDGTAFIQAGAGIVNDSDPEKEYSETLLKAKGLLKAFEEFY